MEKKISVLMTCFNASKYIIFSLESIIKQKYKNWELIIIDDHSSDNSTEIIKKFNSKKIKLYKLNKHIGRTASLNYGLKKIKSNYIAILDADDLALKDRFSDQIDFLDKNKHIDLVGSWASTIDEKGKTINNRILKSNLKSLESHMMFRNVFSHSSVMFRKKILKKVKKYPIEFIYMQDYAFILNIMKYFKIYILPKVLVQNRVVKSSMTFTVPSKRINEERLKLLYYTSKNFNFNFSTRILWLIELTKVNIKSFFI